LTQETEIASTPSKKDNVVQLDQPIVRGKTTITEIEVRKPKSGELRGLSLIDIGRLETAALHKLLPRITIPPITTEEAQELDPSDLMALGVEAASFLMQKRQKTDFQNA
jgi:hypothetical protein